MDILRPRGSNFAHFAIDGDGCIWTDDCADCATGAAILVDMGRMVTPGCQMCHIQAENLLGADTETQFTTLTIRVRNFDPAGYGHTLLLHKKVNL